MKCSSKRSFICESNFIYPEVDIKKYDVGITIDQDARATVNIQVGFDELPSDEDSKDVPLTLVVPKQAGMYSKTCFDNIYGLIIIYSYLFQ